MAVTAGWRVHAELKAGTGVWTYCSDPHCERQHYLYKPFHGVVGLTEEKKDS